MLQESISLGTARWGTILCGITNNSLRFDTTITGYAGLLLGGRTILPGIANNSPSVDCFRDQYRPIHRVTATILSGIANSFLTVDCIRNQDRWTQGWEHYFARYR